MLWRSGRRWWIRTGASGRTTVRIRWGGTDEEQWGQTRWSEQRVKKTRRHVAVIGQAADHWVFVMGRCLEERTEVIKISDPDEWYDIKDSQSKIFFPQVPFWRCCMSASSCSFTDGGKKCNMLFCWLRSLSEWCSEMVVVKVTLES